MRFVLISFFLLMRLRFPDGILLSLRKSFQNLIPKDDKKNN